MKTLLEKWRSGLLMADRPDEYEVKCLLAQLGLHVPQAIRILPGTTAVAPDFPGPYVAKVCSAEILHKTEFKGVRLNVEAGQLAATARDLRQTFPDTPLLVEQMVAFEGPEMIAGGLIDPAFGPAVMAGAGGLLTEITQDAAFRLVPLDEAEALRMLMELRLYPVFEGFRGLRLDPSALARLIVALSRLVDALGSQFDQLDLNPVVWTEKGWTILDAKLILYPGP